ncbi:hypothetical protein ABXN37_19610 [Piscinibacter sakaiensis]|uniref:Uncharacterized protein n=1 Tax=Piscinibacter sakaiensis TaxID=1547922 RepID=A0A0K8P3W2_PISS1|nr:hypothetical protein [Piscinibacter sakaiensis]GAP37333.1 hypothetical protein ISF6_3188 [Piscinibacter sakaiensis]
MCRACWSRPVWRLPLADGRRVFMEFHAYLGPSLFRDRACRREIETWYEDPGICAAVQWFVDRGRRA